MNSVCAFQITFVRKSLLFIHCRKYVPSVCDRKIISFPRDGPKRTKLTPCNMHGSACPMALGICSSATKIAQETSQLGDALSKQSGTANA